mmetsp:Transcript_86176/g.242725  ORF Transcript_86176/g.242725 Transcript_86176/m.242725 type:complete len:219 (-) Transcript_86176:61-717(-)
MVHRPSPAHQHPPLEVVGLLYTQPLSIGSGVEVVGKTQELQESLQDPSKVLPDDQIRAEYSLRLLVQDGRVGVEPRYLVRRQHPLDVVVAHLHQCVVPRQDALQRSALHVRAGATEKCAELVSEARWLPRHGSSGDLHGFHRRHGLHRPHRLHPHRRHGIHLLVPLAATGSLVVLCLGRIPSSLPSALTPGSLAPACSSSSSAAGAVPGGLVARRHFE